MFKMFKVIIFFISVLPVCRAQCKTSQLFDAAYFSDEVPKLRKMLGGHTDIDLVFPFFKEGSPFGNVVIQCPCDLECYDFDSFLTRSCRWHNEQNKCDGRGDELNWIRMRGAWGRPGEGIFFAKDKPDGFFLFAGIQQKMPELYSAMLVSDPIQCQQGDGKIQFRHWTSPGVKVRVCVRPPSAGRNFLWCSSNAKRKAAMFTTIIIPGSILEMFEIVIEAFGFTLDAFGVQGGAAAIDDISYNASAIYRCELKPHRSPLQNVSSKVCDAIQCNFDSGTCLKKLGNRWHIAENPVGSNETGITGVLEGSFAYVQGPGDATISLDNLSLPRTYGLQFCYFLNSVGPSFDVLLHPKDSTDELVLFNTTTSLNSFSNKWMCKRVFLSVNGTIIFNVKNLRNNSMYFGLDEIDIFDPLTSLSGCAF